MRLAFLAATMVAVLAVDASEPSLWTDNGRPNGDAVEALAVLRESAAEGLDPRDYGVDDLEREAAAVGQALTFENHLTATLARYLSDLHQGRLDPRAIGFSLQVPDDRHDYAAVIAEAARAHRVRALVSAWRPQLAQYRLLAEALRRARAQAPPPAREEPPLPALPAASRRPPARGTGGVVSVHAEESWVGVGALADRLVARGDLEAGDRPAGERYEGLLVDAVRHFQARHGLEADGTIGPATIAALSVPLTWRTRQIEMALERLRWLPHLTHERLIVVNIPMFQLWAWDHPADTGPAFTSGVIVGRAVGTETPVLSRDLLEVIYRPYWNVPTSILRKEILPQLRRRPQYLVDEAMEIVGGQGDDAAVLPATPENLERLRSGAYRLRQRPGPRNSLGLVKFVFPNEADVYMHGTPAPALFLRSRRDFSHGCVRVQNPIGLAEWLLAPTGAWPRERIVAAMNADAVSQHVRVEPPVQVLLFYTTAAVQQDGTLRFADDIYGHDRRLDAALRAR